MSAVPLTWPFRLSRAAVFAAVCLGLGALAHRLAGGCLPASDLIGGLMLAYGAALPLAMRERSLVAILPALAGVQVALHTYFCLAEVSSVAEVAERMHGHGCCELVPSPGMLLMHGAATVLTAFWLARGEALLWSLLRRVGARLVRLIVARPGRGPLPVRVPCTTEPDVLRSAVLRRAVRLRGPPGPGAAVLC